ncbi:MAG: CHAT domain-containing protein [Anaerolineae bacterium]
MTSKAATLRLHVLGKLTGEEGAQRLTTLAEFKESRAVHHMELDRPRLDELNRKIRELRGFIEAGSPAFQEPDLEQLGSELFNLVVGGQVNKLFSFATGAARREDDFLPLEIYVEDYTIAGWPWEYLYDAGQQMFICQEFHPISRGIYTLYGDAGRAPGKVSILLVLGVLPDDRQTTPQEEIRWVERAFGANLADGSVRIKVMDAVTPLELDGELRSGRYNVLHYFGHAAYDEARAEGYLKFERDGDQAFKFYANDLGRLLSDSHFRLVFLNACETGRGAPNEDPARSSVAAALLGRGIPAVIATQFSIPDNSAHYLSSRIYTSLVAGDPLVEAIRNGRRAMSYADKNQFLDWGIPVLYASDPGLVLFPAGSAPRAPTYRGIDLTAKGPRTRGLESFEIQSEARRPTRGADAPNAHVRVALFDMDAKVGFLPDLVDAANRAQSYYDFRVVYLPVPSGAIRTEFDGEQTAPQLFLPRLDDYLGTLPRELNVDRVCCLTRNLIADAEDDQLAWDYFTGNPRSNQAVSVISTFGLREYAMEAGVSYAKATLFLCLAELAISSNPQLEYHDETAGCPFDFCEHRQDVVISLKHMQFDHAPCRSKMQDLDQLAAIDALLALKLE